MAKIIPLSEGAFTVDNTKQFVPFNTETDSMQERPAGSLLVEIQPFLVVTQDDVVLLDTGLGHTTETGDMQIHTLMAQHGYRPADVTKVILSHLHKDHSGGIAMPDRKNVSFENATYYINQNEWEHAFAESSSSYHPADFDVLKTHGSLELTPDQGQIGDTIEYWVTGGHSKYHQAILIKDSEGAVFFGGDVAPQLQQMKNRFKAKYDYDGARSMELRQEWWNRGKEEHWTFLFYHDIRSPFLKL